MASWITHTIIADRLISRMPGLDVRGFCIGSIAPDCNVENADWTAFTPPREVTHWMSGASKLSADYEGFYMTHLHGRRLESEERSFLLGYYAHLVTDVEFQRFIRDEERVADSFARIRSDSKLYRRIEGQSETFDTLKKAFGKSTVFGDIAAMEAAYIAMHPEASYETILRKTDAFCEYLDYFPKGAIARKIAVMAVPADKTAASDGYFFSQQEYDGFIMQTSDRIYALLQNK